MKKIKQIGLFLSSFSPLFLLLLIKEIIEIINNNLSLNLLNSTLLIMLSIMFLCGVLTLVVLLNDIKNCYGKRVKVTSKQNTTDQHFLGYFSLFVLFAISFEIEMYSMACVFFLVLLMIAIVYIKNDMYFINPLLNMFGYSYYQIEYQDSTGKTTSSNAFFKGALVVGDKYILCTKYSSLFFLKKS